MAWNIVEHYEEALCAYADQYQDLSSDMKILSNGPKHSIDLHQKITYSTTSVEDRIDTNTETHSVFYDQTLLLQRVESNIRPEDFQETPGFNHIALDPYDIPAVLDFMVENNLSHVQSVDTWSLVDYTEYLHYDLALDYVKNDSSLFSELKGVEELFNQGLEQGTIDPEYTEASSFVISPSADGGSWIDIRSCSSASWLVDMI